MKLVDSSGWVEFLTDGPLAGDYAEHLADPRAVLTPTGRAFLDRHHRMVLRGGLFSAGDEESNRLRWALQSAGGGLMA